MKLADYLYEYNLSPARLRKRLGIRCRSTVWRYLNNERIPKPVTLQKIITLTDGRVQLKDFLDTTPPDCARLVRRPEGSERLALPWSVQPDGGDERPEDHVEPRISNPVKRAIAVLEGRAWFTPKGVFLLDGKNTDLRRMMRAANLVLRKQGKPPIPYPGEEPPEGDQI